MDVTEQVLEILDGKAWRSTALEAAVIIHRPVRRKAGFSRKRQKVTVDLRKGKIRSGETG